MRKSHSNAPNDSQKCGVKTPQLYKSALPLYLVKAMIRVVIVKKVGLGERQQRSAKALRGLSKFYLNREVKGATTLTRKKRSTGCSTPRRPAGESR